MALIERSQDAVFLNHVLNDPSVKPWVSLGYKVEFDLTEAVEDSRNIFLCNEWGGFLLMNSGEGLYDLHTQFLPEGRGASALKAARESLRYLFVETDCLAIRTFIADENRAADRLARWMRFVPVEIDSVNGHKGQYFLLTIKRWVQEFKVCQPH